MLNAGGARGAPKERSGPPKNIPEEILALANRETDADRADDRRSLERRLADSLYLLVKRGDVWTLPGVALDEEESVCDAALRALVRRMAHSFRMFLVVTTLACLGECFAASLYAVSVHADVLSDGDRRDLTRALGCAVPSALRLLLHAWGTALNLRAATLATHRMQKTGSYLSERQARITAAASSIMDLTTPLVPPSSASTPMKIYLNF